MTTVSCRDADVGAVSERGVVTAAHPIAADVGVSLLRQDATVYDAAVAAALAETVLLPPKCGLAGDVVALVFRAGEPEPEALVSVGTAPRRLGAVAREKGLPATGGLSVGIPGASAGYRALAARGGLGLVALARPAIDLAREGFPWPEVSAYLTEQSLDVLRAQNPGGVVYLPGGGAAPVGAPTALPGLAEVLEAFVASSDGPFDGAIGDAVYEAIRSRGGVIQRDELGTAQARWSKPARSGSTDGTVLWATPVPTHGPSLLEVLATAPRGASPAALVQYVEHAITNRARDAGDNAVGGGTSVVTAADRWGNAVVLVHSNSFQRYGSGIVVEPYGLVLSNRAGRGFAASPGHPNFPTPGRRPVTTLHAWAAGLPDRSVLAGATPGGENQMRWNSQTLASILTGEHDPTALVTEPRWGRFGGQLTVEEGLAASDIATLQALCGPDGLVLAPRHALRSAQQTIHFRTPAWRLRAGADPRTGAAARGV